LGGVSPLFLFPPPPPTAEHADRLLAGLADAPLSTRELHCWFEHYQKAFRGAREHMVSRPRLFLDACGRPANSARGFACAVGPKASAPPICDGLRRSSLA
jgi:hypothetical protein